jgi:hypothetical protein
MIGTISFKIRNYWRTNRLYLIYLPANSWWVIRVGYPDLEILTTSKTPQHRSCFETRSSSYWPGSCLAFGFMQRMKWGVVFSNWCISLKSWLCRQEQPLNILQNTNYARMQIKKRLMLLPEELLFCSSTRYNF